MLRTRSFFQRTLLTELRRTEETAGRGEISVAISQLSILKEHNAGMTKLRFAYLFDRYRSVEV